MASDLAVWTSEFVTFYRLPIAINGTVIMECSQLIDHEIQSSSWFIELGRKVLVVSNGFVWLVLFLCCVS